jgi:hypothetical protein
MGPWARSDGWSQVSDVESAGFSPGAAAGAGGRCSCHMAIMTTRVSVEIAAMPREQFQLPMSRLSVGSPVVRLSTYANDRPEGRQIHENPDPPVGDGHEQERPEQRDGDQDVVAVPDQRSLAHRVGQVDEVDDRDRRECDGPDGSGEIFGRYANGSGLVVHGFSLGR